MNGAIGTIIAIACIITCIWRVCSINDSSETTCSGYTASSATSGEYLDYVAPGRSRCRNVLTVSRSKELAENIAPTS